MTDQDPFDEPTRVERPAADPTQAMPVAPGGPPAGRPLPPIDGPPPGPGDPRWWILGALLVLVVLIGLAVLLLGGDDDNNSRALDATTTTSSTLDDTTTTTSSSTTTGATTTTGPTTTTTSKGTTPTVAPGLCKSGGPNDPDSSVQVMYKAFTLGDRDCAEKVATSDAVDELFGVKGNGGGWTYQGCSEEDVPDPHLNCAFTFPGGATHFRTSFNDIDGWLIYEVFQTTD